MYYENFISYRRNECAHEARMLFEALSRRGFATFCDVFTLDSGRYDKKLLDTISVCTNYILIIGPHSLEKRSPDDWLYREMRQAFAAKRNIIPVLVDGASLSGSSYEGIENLAKLNAIRYSEIYFDGFIDSLIGRFMVTNDDISVRDSPADFAISDNELMMMIETGRCIGVPEGIKRIGRSAFKDHTEIKSIELPQSLESIGDSAFERCSSLEMIVLPDSMREIGKRSFSRCYQLGYIKFNSRLERIDDLAFSYCTKLKSVELGEFTKSISPTAFAGCQSLAQIRVADDNPMFVEMNGMLLSKDKTRLLRCPEGLAYKVVEIPESVIEIGPSAFSGCSNIETIICNGRLASIGSGAFKDCIGITEFSYSGTRPSIADDAFLGWAPSQCLEVLPEELLPSEKLLLSEKQKSDVFKRNEIANHEFVMIKTALESREEAYSLADAIVRQRLATSVQIKQMKSIYSWEGQICSEDEFELTCITTGYMYFAVADYITAHHSYELGEIICVPILATTNEFGKWIDDNVNDRQELI